MPIKERLQTYLVALLLPGCHTVDPEAFSWNFEEVVHVGTPFDEALDRLKSNGFNCDFQILGRGTECTRPVSPTCSKRVFLGRNVFSPTAEVRSIDMNIVCVGSQPIPG